ncbi:MAG: Uma2 family endonuclease [Candidatus Xenobia bacterium]
MTLHHQVSFDEFMSWPETRPYREYINGEVRQKAMPNAAHSLTQNAMGTRLEIWDPEGAVVTEQRCILHAGERSQTVLPDVAWFAQNRFTTNDKGFAIVPPQLAVEILSPDDHYAEVEEKVTVYLDAGVSLVWIVDPIARNVTVHRPVGRPVVVSTDGVLEDPILPGFALSLTELFGKLDRFAPRAEEQP